MARWFPGVAISRIHGTAKHVDAASSSDVPRPPRSIAHLRAVIEATRTLPALVAAQLRRTTATPSSHFTRRGPGPRLTLHHGHTIRDSSFDHTAYRDSTRRSREIGET